MLKFKYPKGRSVGFSLLFFVAFSLQGCCSCQERYAPFLDHAETTLRESVAPLLDEALAASQRPDDLRANDVGEVTDLADAFLRIRTQGADAWQVGE